MSGPRQVTARFIASGFGSGLIPVAPGTFGSLVGVLIGAVLLATRPEWMPAAVIVATAAGVWAIPAARVSGDPGWVVIDEIAGQLLALAPLPRATPLELAAGFALFRLLDITKPWPIRAIDRRPDAIGVMGDDLAAGAVVALILWVLTRALPDAIPRMAS